MTWEQIEQKYQKLLEQQPQTLEQLEQWLLKRSQLMMENNETFAWLYIRAMQNTADQQASKAFNDFLDKVYPKIIEYDFKLDKKLYTHPLFKQLSEKYPTVTRRIENHVKLHVDKNIPLIAKAEKLSNEFAQITSRMTIRCQGKELTLQQAAKYLMDPQRSMRKKIYNKIANRRLKDYQKLNSLLDQLIELRTKIANNAGFNNYRDYKHQQLGRFDYSVDDVLQLDRSIALTAVPIYEQALELRKNKLKLKTLKPWDLDVDLDKKPALHVFDTTEEFIEKSITVLSAVKPEYGNYLKTMYQKGFLDLESRKNKAPGGFNYPLYVSKVPFIFMNASGTINDFITLMHEAGHAIHSFLTADLNIIEHKDLPSEIAELASMSMELISMEHWDKIFPNKEELKRAKRYQLERVIEVLPWIALIDSFQHWIYTIIPHSTPERYAAWLEEATTYFPPTIDWQGQEWYFANLWQKQLHIFEVPFYYIEYAIAQLGAIAIWRNYKKNPDTALEQYENALKLGYTKTIPEIYQAAGIEFNFSANYIHELLEFVWQQYKQLINVE